MPQRNAREYSQARQISLQAVSVLQQSVELRVEIAQYRLCLRLANQVRHLIRIIRQVVQLVHTGEFDVPDEFPPLRSDRAIAHPIHAREYSVGVVLNQEGAAPIPRTPYGRREAIGKGEDPIDIVTRRVQRLSKSPVHRWNGNFEGERADLGRVRP